MLMAAVWQVAYGQVMGTTCGNEALEQGSGRVELGLSITPRPTKVKVLCSASFSLVATEPSILATLGLWEED